MSEMVPEGWQQITIDDLGSFYGGLTGKTSNHFGSGEPFLTYMQVYSQKTSEKEAVDFVLMDKIINFLYCIFF